VGGGGGGGGGGGLHRIRRPLKGKYTIQALNERSLGSKEGDLEETGGVGYFWPICMRVLFCRV